MGSGKGKVTFAGIFEHIEEVPTVLVPTSEEMYWFNEKIHVSTDLILDLHQVSVNTVNEPFIFQFLHNFDDTTERPFTVVQAHTISISKQLFQTSLGAAVGSNGQGGPGFVPQARSRTYPDEWPDRFLDKEKAQKGTSGWRMSKLKPKYKVRYELFSRLLCLKCTGSRLSKGADYLSNGVAQVLVTGEISGTAVDWAEYWLRNFLSEMRRIRGRKAGTTMTTVIGPVISYLIDRSREHLTTDMNVALHLESTAPGLENEDAHNRKRRRGTQICKPTERELGHHNKGLVELKEKEGQSPMSWVEREEEEKQSPMSWASLAAYSLLQNVPRQSVRLDFGFKSAFSSWSTSSQIKDLGSGHANHNEGFVERKKEESPSWRSWTSFSTFIEYASFPSISFSSDKSSSRSNEYLCQSKDRGSGHAQGRLPPAATISNQVEDRLQGNAAIVLQCLDDMTFERDQARAIIYETRVERDQARARRDEMRVERDQARAMRDEMRVERDQAIAMRDTLQANLNKIEHGETQKECSFDETRTKRDEAKIERDVVQEVLDKIEQDLGQLSLDPNVENCWVTMQGATAISQCLDETRVERDQARAKIKALQKDLDKIQHFETQKERDLDKKMRAERDQARVKIDALQKDLDKIQHSETQKEHRLNEIRAERDRAKSQRDALQEVLDEIHGQQEATITQKERWLDEMKAERDQAKVERDQAKVERAQAKAERDQATIKRDKQQLALYRRLDMVTLERDEARYERDKMRVERDRDQGEMETGQALMTQGYQ